LRAAYETSEWCAAHKIPVRKLTPQQIAFGWYGICGHADWTESGRFRNPVVNRGTHTDPGRYFPWDVFMQLVRGEDDMATPQEIWDYVVPDYYVGPGGVKAQPKPVRDLLSWSATHAAYAKEQAISNRAEIASLRLAVTELAGEMDMDVDRLVVLMDEKFRAALAEGLVDVDIEVRDRTEGT
ncbi:MAG: hypothetical protein ACREX8_04190, partial [Gammaproteobacteria bacterium]